LPDGQSLVFSGPTDNPPGLWRVPAGRAGNSERIELAGEAAYWPAVAPNGDKLAFERTSSQADIWRWQHGALPEPFLSSSVADTNPQFSPDGRRIAFDSHRGGSGRALWVANADGTGLLEMLKGFDPGSGTPAWSPDGKWLAFDSLPRDGRWDVWRVEAAGGSPQRLTDGRGDNQIPSWSRDGKHVYFASNRTGRSEVWCVPAGGGAARQVTFRGGHVGFESLDGKSLYYSKTANGTDGVYACSLAGGEERQVITDRVVWRNIFVAPTGIYYITPEGRRGHEIRFRDFATTRTERVLKIDGPVRFGLSVSADQKTFLFARWGTEADLMLIRNYR
jgi:Tol biopolymer transport system component